MIYGFSCWTKVSPDNYSGTPHKNNVFIGFVQACVTAAARSLAAFLDLHVVLSPKFRGRA